ncbi:MAG: lytic transglycosylase domain-containing protein [Nocardioides sp.]|nr:lytic transglycosylase domain-containing protein [Nocardioides sp.]
MNLADSASPAAAQTTHRADHQDRAATVSRSSDRTQGRTRGGSGGGAKGRTQSRTHNRARSATHRRTDPAKRAALRLKSGPAVSGQESLSNQSPQTIAATLLPSYGFDSSQMSCLIPLWMGESGWRVDAMNPSSGAYGIPQSLPAEKMASVAPDWRTNPVTQIKWGLGYIRSSYGSPCSAWAFKQSNGWY